MARVFDIIEHPDVASNELSYRLPQTGSGDFRIGSQLIVRDNQAAVFVRGGEALDAFEAGTHTITTANVPLLVGLIGKAFSGETPFKAEAYFINTADFPQIGWGTTQPLPLETPGKGLGWLLVQGHGVMDIRVSEPSRFAKQYAIGKPIIFVNDVKERLLTIVLGELQDVISTNAPGDLAKLNSMIGELEGAVVAKAKEKFEELGLLLKGFEMKPLSASRTTAQDLRDMGLLDVATYQQLQAADALREAAQNEGGGAAATGVGLGAGMSLGQAMAGIMTQETGGDADEALNIARERLAKGEITVEEFNEIQEALGG